MESALPIPATLDELDPAWLCRALDLPEGAIAQVHPGPAAGGIAIAGQVARLRLVPAPGVRTPASVVAKIVNPDWQATRELYAREVRFYRELAARHPLPVPTCLYADIDPEDRGFVLLLEDLSDARPGHRLDGFDADEARLVLQALARLHAGWWESGALRDVDWPVKTYSERYAEELQDRFVARWPQVRDDRRFPMTVATRAAARDLADAVVTDLMDLSRGPRTLIHGDLHSENLLLDGQRVVFIDWQNAALGNPALDVASILSGAVSPQAQRDAAPELLAAYARALRAGGVEAWTDDGIAAGVGAATRWLFAGTCCWLARFQTDCARDAKTAAGHLERLGEGLVIWG